MEHSLQPLAENSPIAPDVTAFVARGLDSNSVVYIENSDALLGFGGGCVGGVDGEPLLLLHCRLAAVAVVVGRCRAHESRVCPTNAAVDCGAQTHKNETCRRVEERLIVASVGQPFSR